MTEFEIELLTEHTSYSLREVCLVSGVHAEFVCDLVDEGIVAPRGPNVTAWRFDGVAIVRIQKALRLHRDLGINLPGIALALDLLAERDALRGRRS